PFDPAVPTAIIIMAVLVVLQVGLVVALVVGVEIGQGETVMGRDEVDARPGFAALVVEEGGAAEQALGEARSHGFVAAPEGAHDVTVGAIPFRPSRREVAELIAIRRSEEHTSELQSRENLVCRLLLEKKKKKPKRGTLSRQ